MSEREDTPPDAIISMLTEEINSFVGNGLRMLIRLSVPAEENEETVQAVLKEMKAYYADHYHDLTLPYPGILDMLRSCNDAAVALAEQRRISFQTV